MVLTHHHQQQYLCPDYINPLTSTSTDSTKSPLALLAQTCNNIGISPNSEPSSSVSKSSSKNLTNGVLSKNNNNTNPLGGGGIGANGGRNSAELSEKSSSSGSSSSNSTDRHHIKDNNNDAINGKRSKHNGGGGAQSSDSTAPSADHSDHRHHKDGGHKKSILTKTEENAASKRANPETNKTIDPISNGANESKNSKEIEGHSLSPSTSKHATGPTSQSTGLPPASPSLSINQNYANFFSHYFSPSSSAAAFPFSSAAAAAGILPPSLGCYSQQPFLTPGLFQRLCTDPFCKNCPPSAAAASSLLNPAALSYAAAAANPVTRPGACPSGCTQCALAPSMDLASWLNPYSSLFALHGLPSTAAPHPLLLSALSPPGSSGAPNLPGTGSAASFLNAFCPNPSSTVAGVSAAGGLVCNLFNGDKFCGKVFTNTDELAAHFRGHAASVVASVSASAGVSTSTSTPCGHCCQWNSGDKVCGKIFPTADELAQHLRTHSQEVIHSNSNNNINSNSTTLHSPNSKNVPNSSSSSSIPISSTNNQISSSAVHLPSNSSAILSTCTVGSGRLSPRSSSISASYLNSLNALRYHPYKLPGMAGPPNLLAQGAAYPSFALPSNAYNSLQAAAFLGAQKLPATFPQL